MARGPARKERRADPRKRRVGTWGWREAVSRERSRADAAAPACAQNERAQAGRATPPAPPDQPRRPARRPVRPGRPSRPSRPADARARRAGGAVRGTAERPAGLDGGAREPRPSARPAVRHARPSRLNRTAGPAGRERGAVRRVRRRSRPACRRRDARTRSGPAPATGGSPAPGTTTGTSRTWSQRGAATFTPPAAASPRPGRHGPRSAPARSRPRLGQAASRRQLERRTRGQDRGGHVGQSLRRHLRHVHRHQRGRSGVASFSVVFAELPNTVFVTSVTARSTCCTRFFCATSFSSPHRSSSARPASPPASRAPCPRARPAPRAWPRGSRSAPPVVRPGGPRSYAPTPAASNLHRRRTVRRRGRVRRLRGRGRRRGWDDLEDEECEEPEPVTFFTVSDTWPNVPLNPLSAAQTPPTTTDPPHPPPAPDPPAAPNGAHQHQRRPGTLPCAATPGPRGLTCRYRHSTSPATTTRSR